MTKEWKNQCSSIYAQTFFEHGPEVMVWYSLLWGVWEGIVDGER